MQQGAFFEKRPISAPGLVAVIAIHAAVLTAVALSKTEVIRFQDRVPKTWNIPNPKDPPENPPPKLKEQVPSPHETLTHIDPTIEIPIDRTPSLGKLPALSTQNDGDAIIAPPRPIDPPGPPVRIDAVIDSGAEVQPAYPAAEQRMGIEGKVVIRVLIGTDGRVKAAAKVSATSDAFYRATERQALRYWRFKPATLDGKPIESWKEIAVRFRLDG